jgi:hypothetical protein
MQRISFRKKWAWVLLIIFTMMLGLPWPALAQVVKLPIEDKTEAGPGPQDYNPERVTTVKGQVKRLGGYGMTGWRVAPGMHPPGLVLKNDEQSITVDLGPPWFLNQQCFSIKKGDNLEVTGSKIVIDHQTVLLAAEVKKDGQTLRLRDEKGAPLWQEQGGGDQEPVRQGSPGRGFGSR